MHTRVMILALCVVAAVAIASTNVVFYNTSTLRLCYGGGASTNVVYQPMSGGQATLSDGTCVVALAVEMLDASYAISSTYSTSYDTLTPIYFSAKTTTNFVLHGTTSNSVDWAVVDYCP